MTGWVNGKVGLKRKYPNFAPNTCFSIIYAAPSETLIKNKVFAPSYYCDFNKPAPRGILFATSLSQTSIAIISNFINSFGSIVPLLASASVMHILKQAPLGGAHILLSLLLMCTIPAQAQQAPNLPSVMVHEIVEKDVTPEFRYVGRVVAVDTVSIRARVAGILEKRNFIEGRNVEKGQVLFEIEKAPYEVIVDQRKAELASAEARLTNANADFKRKQSLQDRDVISEASLDQSQAEKLSAEAEVLKAKACLLYTSDAADD